MDFSLHGKERLNSALEELTSLEFTEFVAKLAVYRYSRGGWPARLRRMVEEDILPRACSANVDVFRERLAGNKVKAVLRKHRRALGLIYASYAADDTGSADAPENLDSMNANELVAFARQMGLVGPGVSERQIKVLFAYVQHDEETLVGAGAGAGAEGGDAVEGNDNEMVFSEFCEACFAICAQMRPDPYNVMQKRIDGFLGGELLPKAAVMRRFRGKNIKAGGESAQQNDEGE